MSDSGPVMLAPPARRARIDVLADMGIVSWLPRRALPGAPDADIWQLRGTAAPPGSKAGAAPSGPAAAAGPALEEARRLIADPSPHLRSAEPAPAATHRPVAANGLPGAGPAPVPVCLELQMLRPGLALLVQWPAGGPSAGARMFLADLVYALGVVPEALPAPLSLDWQQNAAGSLADAVAGFLAALATGWLVAVGVGPEAALARSLPAGVRLLELPSIPQMIAEPGRKADAWKRLAHVLAPDGASS